MTGAEDVPLRAPSLLDLSARVVSQSCSYYSGCSTSSDDSERPHLPLPTSHALLRQLRQTWNSCPTESRRDVCVRGLRAWCDAERLPLNELDLSHAHIDDLLLADLLTAHKNTLTRLDLSGVEGVNGDANSLLETRCVHIPKLQTLRLTAADLLSTAPPRRKSYNVGDDRNIPMLGEEELAEHIERNGPLLRPTPNHPYDQFAQPSASGLVSSPSSSSTPAFSPFSTQNSHLFFDLDDDTYYTDSQPITSKCPNITELYIPRHKRYPEDEETSVNDLLKKVFEPLPNLRLLDLSSWQKVDDLRCISPLKLTTLILYDVADIYRALETILQLSELRFLDVSQSIRETGTYPRPVITLHRIVSSLPNLTHLDISGTNLASQPSPLDRVNVSNPNGLRSDIAGLCSLQQPLEYLGLFNCDNASHVAEIPAKRVSGDANEDQVVTALQMYGERAGLLQAVLNESYQLYRFGNTNPLTRHTEALHLVLAAMERHLQDSTLQIAGSASLFYIIRRVEMNRDTKKSVISALLSGMEAHMEEQVMVRNCCLSLCQFEIPQEILFDYSRLAVLLVKVLEHHNSDNLTQRIVVFLLNSMACHVEGDQKVQVGTFGAIEMILHQIRRKLQANTCDDVMEVGWSFLWNITDETSVNCERFLNAEGLQLFHKCYEAFRNERELVRNMMGLIGNIAEVDSLRVQLMKDEYIRIFCALLDLVEESIEISYNSAGVLAHIVSDGEEAWKGLEMSRETVMDHIVRATEQWRLDTRRFINYRSFRPILRLLPQWHAHASQHWAVWALANLTTTDPHKYCTFVVTEGGMDLLEALQTDPRTTEKILKLVKVVLDNIHKWRTSPSTSASNPDSVSVEPGDEDQMDTE